MLRAKTLPSKHEFEKTQVECHSGYKANEYPVAFVFEGARLEAAEIVDRWYEGGLDPEQPVIDYFGVRSEDGRIFILMYAGHLDQWFIRRITAGKDRLIDKPDAFHLPNQKPTVMDKEKIKKLAQNPDFISGIYNYCDRWCERCAFTSRCMNFAMGKEFFADQASHDAKNDHFWEAMSRIFEVTMELLYDLAEEKGIDLDQAISSVDTEQEDRQRRSVDNNICSILARKYAKMAGKWLEENEALLICQGEQLKIPGVVSALEGLDTQDTIEIVRWYQYLIYVKVNRALYGKMQASEDSLENDEYDANGSAKVALIGIEKSIAAWGLLHSCYGQDNSQLQEILFYLERLRRKVMNLFPGAQFFIRPGFDG